MFSFNRLSIALKLAVVAGLAIGALMIVAAVGVTAYSGAIVRDMAGRYAESAAQEASQEIRNEIVSAGTGAKTLAATLGAARQTGLTDRAAYLALVKPNAEATDQVMGAWFMAAPDAVGADAAHRGDAATSSNVNGRLSIYWVRRDGQIAMEPEADGSDFEQAYYTEPMASGAPVVVEPYEESIAGGKVAMTSVAYPVRANGRIIGVAGLDITLANLSQRLAAMKPLGTGRVALVSNKGVWVAHPDAAVRGQAYADAGADIVRNVIAKRQAQAVEGVSVNGEPVRRLVQPVILPGQKATWAVVLDIPVKTIEGPARQLALMLLVGGVLIIAAIIVALLITSDRLIRRPLARLTADVRTMSDGRYDIPVAGADKADELGRIARALEGFRLELADGLARRDQQQRERAAAETDRRRHAEETELFAASQTRAVETLGEGLSRLAAGELAWIMPEAGFTADTRRIPEDYNAALHQLHTTMTGIWTTAQSMRGGCQDIAAAADSLSRRTEQQAAGLEQTAAALDELTQTVRSSAENAERARGITEAAKAAADKGEAVVHDAIGAMSEIEQSSTQINQIVGVIDEIAFQTSLLALNAGVEAARAGEAGRGFAVVASEVRGLAERSASAAKEIKALIALSQSNVQRGSDQVSLTRDSLSAIAVQVAEANALVRTIAAATREQSVGIGEINVAINQMDQFTQQNAAMVEESTAASHALTNEAGELEGLISRFDLGQTAQSRRAA
ncbi:methyl-accepting chemotaxis protein [Brevundimonas vesicularis]|uniref:HAMP domain-containing protein n=1 Tax=Brevundimonas vesicularis TaxID=41276 RepID=A0A1Z3U639_BREVE|nr:methyl-accepting chemotaxis protein [Brevundimonas vesicularis]ASE38749.1 HAMP domain-containing protein [Brevundimonas vesicularis]MDX2336008.1 methyl-accepting chemotaxis protein [Brevundimonas vesicularis]